MKNTIKLVAVTVLAAGCGGAQKPSTAWNPKAQDELKAQVTQLFHNLDALDFKGMAAMFDENPIVFDVDPGNAIVAFYGQKETMGYVDAFAAGAKQGGLKVQSTINRVDCEATDGFGFCTVEFDQMIEMGGQKAGPFKFRGTGVGRKVGGQWKWAHWHGSFREAPPAVAK